MPFPSEEIENAYNNSLAIVQGSFREDPALYAEDAEMMLLYHRLIGHLSPEAKIGLDELIDIIHALGAYENRHYFTEGWLMAQGQKRKPRM